MKKIRLNRRVREAFQGSSRGLTLIEVVIAIALVGIIAIAFMSALSTASTVLIITDERATAESLAKTQLEYVKNQDYNPAPDGGVATYNKTTDIPYGYSIWSFNGTAQVDSIVGVPWVSGNNTAADTDTGLQKIMLVIKHEGKQVITLEGYKRSGAEEEEE